MTDQVLKGALEDNILTLLVWDDKYCGDVVAQIKPSLFSTRAYRRIAETAYGYIDRYNRAPKVHIKDLLETVLRSTDEGRLIATTIDAMDELRPVMDVEFVASQLNKFIETREIYQALEKASDALESGDNERARDALSKPANRIPDSKGILLSDPRQSLSFLDQRDEDYFSSGIDQLDDLGVRPARKTMMLMIGSAKQGKSWWLINVGKANLMQRKKVMHITLENSEELTASRYVQSLFGQVTRKTKNNKVAMFVKDDSGRCTGIEFDTITPELIETEARGKLAKKIRSTLKNRPPLWIKGYSSGTLTMRQLESFMDAKAREGFVPDILLIDYPDLMEIKGEDKRQEIGRHFVNLRGLADRRNMAVCAVTQGNRTSARAKVLHTDMVGEDWSKIGTADTVLTFSRTKAEKDLGLGRVFVAAARSVEDQFMVLVSQSYATGQFALDSVYMTNEVTKDIERISGVKSDAD